MGFQNLTHVHSLRYAEWVQDDIDGVTIFVKRHILHRLDHRDHTFVTVTSSHFVTWLNTTLDRQIDLHNLEDTRRQVIAALQLAFAFVKLFIESNSTLFQA